MPILPFIIELLPIAALIPLTIADWPSPPTIEPNPAPPIPGLLFIVPFPMKPLPPLRIVLLPVGKIPPTFFTSFPKEPTGTMPPVPLSWLDIIISCKIFWTELGESLGSASLERVGCCSEIFAGEFAELI
ncbi:hypothetical protein CFOL_v3_16028 [Cephalotus follicularis]|uniref:Uncharacterized protein n=1 Tax=Cephalotus follicularis TaxID=3775 RepID=A0A1Q3BX19_CEPFO|nr:hypothetical protein CFOL_v3_16028 [Cephalotus follicularis]